MQLQATQQKQAAFTSAQFAFVNQRKTSLVLQDGTPHIIAVEISYQTVHIPNIQIFTGETYTGLHIKSRL